MKVKRSLKDMAWPSLETEHGRKDAIQYGAVAAGWVALSYLVALVYMFATGELLFGGAIEGGTVFAGVAIVLAVIVGGAAFVCWRLWRAKSPIAAYLTLGWVLIEVAVKLAMAPGAGLVISAIMTLAAIHGVRGTRAQARHGATGAAG